MVTRYTHVYVYMYIATPDKVFGIHNVYTCICIYVHSNTMVTGYTHVYVYMYIATPDKVFGIHNVYTCISITSGVLWNQNDGLELKQNELYEKVWLYKEKNVIL